MLQRAHGRHSMQCATHNVSHARPLARCLPPRAGPVKSALGPARRCVACHDSLLVGVARAAVVCVARRLSQVVCCRCADTASAHESTPQQPPAARQYSRAFPTETGLPEDATWQRGTVQRACGIGRHLRTARRDDGAEDTRAHRCVEGEAQQQDHEELHNLRMKVPTGRGRNKRISLSISSTSQLRVAKTQA
jgi:hypothetical protein